MCSVKYSIIVLAKHFFQSCPLTALFACFIFFVPATDLLLAWNPVCLGLVEGVIGKIRLHTGKKPKIIVHFSQSTHILLGGSKLCCGNNERCDTICQSSVCRKGVSWL